MLVTTQTENPFRDCSVRAKEKVSTVKMASTLKGKQKYLNKKLQAEFLLKKAFATFFWLLVIGYWFYKKMFSFCGCNCIQIGK